MPLKLLSLNHYWRICAAGISYILFAIGGLLPGVYIVFLAVAPMSAAAKQRRVRGVIQRLCRLYVNIMQFLGLMNYALHGERPSQLRGHVVISNHTMLIDALFALAYVENLCCIVKGQLVYNPFTAIPVKLAGYIANDDPELAQHAADKLSAGENILIFPEGTRNQHDLQLDFKRGAANIAILAEAPILPLVTCCMPRALGKGESWWQLPEVKSLIVMRFDPVINYAEHIDTDLPRTRQYRDLTQWLREYYRGAITEVLDAHGP